MASKRPRADVVRNRASILAAAQEAFREHGADASYEEIARRAGVGSATLYRHYPTRYALLEEVVRTQVSELCARGRTLLGEGDPFSALRQWLRDLMVLSGERGLAEALLRTRRQDTQGFLDACHSEIADVALALLERAQRAGQARRDVDAGDVLALVSMIAAEHGGPVRHPEGAGSRLLDLVLDGLHRPDPGAGRARAHRARPG